MERSSIQEEENHAPWSSGSVIPIRAITIELKFPTEMPQTSENCHHSNFSIRGYAAVMRRRNPKTSDPFQFDDIPMSDTPEGPTTPLSKGQENVPDAADVEIEPLEPCADTDCDVRDDQANATDDSESDYEAINISHVINNDNDKITTHEEKETDDEFDDLLPISQLRKAVPRSSILLTLDSTAPNTHEANVAMSTAPAHDTSNETSDSDQSEDHVPSITVSRRKVRKLRKLSELFSDDGTKNRDHLLGAVASTGPPHGQILSDHVITDANCPQTKVEMHQHQEGDGSRGQVTVAEKSNDPGTNEIAKTSQITSSGGQANAPSGAGLQLGSKTHRLKRVAEGNHSLVTKKAKSAQTFPPSKISERKNADVTSDDFKRYSMSNSFGSPSAAAEPNTNSPDKQSSSGTGRITIDLTQTELQIPNSPTVKDGSSRTGLPTLDGHHAWTASTKNQDGGETSSVQRKTDFRLPESIIPPASAQDLLKRRQVLDLNLNETATPNSSYALPKGSFHEPKERDSFQQKNLENQGPWKSSIQQCERRHSKAMVQGSSDDIPMDIVELMAKNQYERTLGINAGSHLGTPRPINNMRSFPEAQNIRNTERPPTVGYHGSNSFSFQNARSVMSTQTTNTGAEKENSINYHQVGSNHFNMGRIGERQPSIFSAFQQNQQAISNRGQFSAAAYLRPVPQHSVVLERSTLLRSTVFPFGPESLQKFSAHTPESSCDKGKTISDIKADELKKTKEARSVLPISGAFDPNHKLMGSYSNEHVPALQLLSLMGERSTGSTFNVGTSRFLDKPPGYQLKSNAEGMRDFLYGSMSLHHNQANGVHNAERPFVFSGALSLDPQGRDRLRERSQISGYVADVSDDGRTSSMGKDYKQKEAVVYSDIAADTQRSVYLETESGHENIMPLRILPPDEFCSVNRNPADFSIPEARNEFTIHGRDIKFRKRKYSVSNSCVRIEEPKQQMNAKGKGKEK